MKRIRFICFIICTLAFTTPSHAQEESYQTRYDRLVNSLQAMQESLPIAIEGLEISSVNPEPKTFVSMMVVVKDRQTFESLTRDVNVLKGQVLSYAGNISGNQRTVLEQTVLANLGLRLTFSNQVYDDFKMVSISSAELKGALGNIASTRRQEAHPLSDDVLAYAEKMPQFNAEKDFSIWVNSHVKYPAKAKSKRIEGRVMVRFVVDENGNVRDVVIEKGVDQDLDAEALRVIRTSPKWTPGEQGGKKVAVYYTVPVTFRLK